MIKTALIKVITGVISGAISKVQVFAAAQFAEIEAMLKRLASVQLRQLVSPVLLVTLVLSALLGCVQPAIATNFDRKNLRQQDFSGQDLTDNDYTRADLTEANLSHANLELVRLFTTRLTRANLEGANLKGATLDGASLVGANLKDANLEGAYAINIDFRGANIEGADFTDVLLDPKDNDRLCEIASGTNSVTGRETRETLYCP